MATFYGIYLTELYFLKTFITFSYKYTKYSVPFHNYKIYYRKGENFVPLELNSIFVFSIYHQRRFDGVLRNSMRKGRARLAVIHS